MNELRNTDALLKRYLKGKFSLTKAVVVSFLITGAVSFAGSNGPVSYLSKYAYTGTPATSISVDYESEDTALSVPTTPTALTSIRTDKVTGAIAVTGENTDGVWIQSSDAATTGTIEGTITNTTVDSTGSIPNYGLVIDGSDATAELTVTNEANITTTADYGLVLQNFKKTFNATVNTSGIINNTGKYGAIVLGGAAGSATSTINNSGTITANSVGMAAFAGATDTSAVVENNGIVNGDMIASVGDGLGAASATNTSLGTVYGDMIAFGGSTAGTAVVTNAGLVTEDMIAIGGSGTGTATAENTGRVNGDMVAQAGVGAAGVTVGATTVTNNGTLAGGIYVVGGTATTTLTAGGTATGTNGSVGNINFTGNYGMLADATTGVGDLTVINYGNIHNEGMYGMAAIAGSTTDSATAQNFGSVANVGNYGMVASGLGASALNGGSEPTSDLTQAITIKNTGDFGMAALNGGTATNSAAVTTEGHTAPQGIIQNTGNVGMLANGVWTTTGGDIVESEAINDGIIQNEKSYGMVAINKGIVVNNATIQNNGDVGMYVGAGSEGWNYGYTSDTDVIANGVTTNMDGIFNKGNVGVYTDGYFVNAGTINPLNTAGGTTYALINGTANSTSVFLNPLAAASTDTYNPIPNKDAVLVNIGGTDVLQFGAVATSETRAAETGIDAILNSDTYFYNYIVGSGLLHDNVADTTVTYKGKENLWTLNGFNYMLGGAPLSTIDSALNTGITGTTGDTVLDTDIALGVDGEVYMVMGRDKDTSTEDYFVSPEIFANSYNPLYTAEGATTGIAKHTNKVLDRSFITSNNTVEFDIVTVDTTNAPTSTTLTVAEAQALGYNTETVSDVVGWTPSYKVVDNGNGTSTIQLVYTKDTGMLGNNSTTYTHSNKAPGGYGDANSYPHSNLDTVNARHIIDRGYLYARKAAFMRPEVTEETVTYPAPVADKPAKKVPVVTEKGKEVVQPPVIEEVVKTYKNYENLQFAEVFGDWGSYSGSGAKYDFDTVGVTGATFHKFHDYPEWMAGLAYGYAHSKVDYENHKGSNEKLNTLGIDAFLSWTRENWLVTGEFGYSWSKHDLKRRFSDYDAEYLVGSVLDRQASKKFDSHQWNLGFEVGYNYIIDPTFSLYPYAGFDYIWNSRDSYTENSDGWSGNEAFSGTMTLDKYTVAVDKNKYDTGVFKLGVMGEKLYERWTFTGDIAWKYYTNDYDGLTGKYVDAAERKENVYFKSNDLNIGNSLGYVHVGVDYAVTPQLSLGVEYTGYYRSKQSGSLFGGNLTYKF